MKNKIFRLNTVAKKNTLILISVSIILLAILALVGPSLFYSITKNDLTNYVSSAVGECSVRMSYILSRHFSTTFFLYDEDAFSVMEDYFAERINFNTANNLLKDKLPVFEEGTPSIGNKDIISCINYSIVSTENGDIFCDESARDVAESFVESGWIDIVPRDGTPSYDVMTLNVNNENIDFLCFTIAFEVSDVVCYSTTLTEFSDILIQLQTMEEVGLTDYTLMFGHDIIFKNLENSAIEPQNYPDELFEGKQNKAVKYENGDGFDFTVRVAYERENLRIAVRVTKDELLEPYSTTFVMLEILFVVLIFILIVISAVIFKLSLKRLERLDKKMSSIRSGNFELKLRDDHNDEIGSLTNTIHMMLERIRSDMHQKIRHEKNERKMQYSLMVSAIDPHFIYNTLDTITFLAAMDKTEEIIAVNDALIGTLKDRLSIKNYKTFDSVEKEKKVVEQYMIIQSYLCHNKIDFDFSADEDVLALQIPKNIIQPLVENSIKHGLLQNKDEARIKIKDGIIKVNVTHENDMIKITVFDNGIGMDENTINSLLREIEPSSIDEQHIGIANMRLRLAYLYQNKFKFKIESIQGGGTTIIVEVPDLYVETSE